MNIQLYPRVSGVRSIACARPFESESGWSRHRWNRVLSTIIIALYVYVFVCVVCDYLWLLFVYAVGTEVREGRALAQRHFGKRQGIPSSSSILYHTIPYHIIPYQIILRLCWIEPANQPGGAEGT